MGGSGKSARGALWTAIIAACALLGGCQSPESAEEQANLKAFETPAESLKIADAARRDGEDETAARLYRKVLSSDSKNYDALMGLGAALAGLNRTAEAIQEFRTAEALQPTRAEPELSLGRLYLLDHRPDLALNEFDAALKLSPGAVAGWNGKGYALDMLERHQEAQEAYRKGLSGAPDDPALQNNYGLSLALSGNYPEAIKVLTALVEQPGATARNRENLALALGLAGHMDDARWVVKDDLPETAITANMRFYEALRKLPPATQTAEVLGGGAPATEAAAAATAPANDASASPITAAALPAPTGTPPDDAAAPSAQPAPAPATALPPEPAAPPPPAAGTEPAHPAGAGGGP